MADKRDDPDEQDWDELIASAYGANPFARKPPKPNPKPAGDDQLDRLRNAWLDADEAGRKRFLRWLEEQFAIKAVTLSPRTHRKR